MADVTGTPIPAGPHEIEITVIAGNIVTTGDVNQRWSGEYSGYGSGGATGLGKTVPANSEIDINGDGIVNILDLILVVATHG